MTLSPTLAAKGAEHLHPVLEDGALQLLNFTTMMLTTYRMLVEYVDGGHKVKEMAEFLNEVFESHLICLKELTEAEQGLDDAVGKELGLGPDAIYSYIGQRCSPLLKRVVPFSITKE